MTELLTAAQMRAIEQAAIASGEVTGLELMERAGRGVVEAILEEWPEMALTSHRAVVLCGPGNNGGDGFVVARLLKERGWEVEVFLYGDAAKLPPDARVNYERWRSLGDTAEWDDDAVDTRVREEDTDLVVDALFGTGLTRGVDGVVHETHEGFIERVYLRKCPVVAIDLPSGLCSDSGKDLGRALAAGLTVTFHRMKLGHVVADGPQMCGRVRVKDIELDHRTKRWRRDAATLVEQPTYGLSKAAPGLLSIRTHKYTHGHALILAGGPGHGGAARLAARGALRIGAGLVTLGAPPDAIPENAAQLTAIMLRKVGCADDLAAALADQRLNALCLGPGLGLTDDTRNMVKEALAAKRKTVLDADALTVFADDPGALFAMLHENVVLTPHAGEFARLFPDIAARLAEPAAKGPAYSKVDATREAAARAGCTVLFKGPDTVIADASGRCAVNSAHYDRAAPWLATAGAGDVLAGFITGLLARGFPAIEAAETAAWLHVECALKFGPGLIAEDLPEVLPAVFRDLGL